MLDYYIADIKKFSSYPHILFINLIDKKGRQGYLGRVWFKSLFYPRDPPKLDTLINRDEITITKVNLHNFLLTFLWFDFHHKYNPNLENNGLSELNPPISEIFDKIGSTFLVNKRKGVIDTQSTLIRTNCIDCLDRTNVVQVKPLIFICVLYNFTIIVFLELYFQNGIKKTITRSKIMEKFERLFSH